MPPKKSIPLPKSLLGVEEVQHAIAIDNLFRVLVTSPKHIPEWGSVGLLPCSLSLKQHVEPILSFAKKNARGETHLGALVKAGDLYLRMKGCDCVECARTTSRAKRVVAGIPSAYFEELSKAWYRRAGAGAWSRITWKESDQGPISAVISRCQYILGADDAPIQGLDWVVASVSEEAYGQLSDDGRLENVVMKTKVGGGYKLALGPGQLIRRACGVCRYSYAKDQDLPFFVTPTYTCHEIALGQEIFGLGGPDLSPDACPQPRHSDFLAQNWAPVNYQDGYLVPLSRVIDIASSRIHKPATSTPESQMSPGVISDPARTLTSPSTTRGCISPSLSPPPSPQFVSDPFSKPLLSNRSPFAATPSSPPAQPAQPSSAASSPSTACPSTEVRKLHAYPLTPVTPAHLASISWRVSQPASDLSTADPSHVERPLKRRAISSRFKLSPLALAIQHRHPFGPAERQEAQTKRRLMECQQRSAEDQAEVHRLRVLFDKEKKMRLEEAEGRINESDRRKEAEKMLKGSTRNEVALEGMLEAAAELAADSQEAEKVAKQNTAHLEVRLADTEMLLRQSVSGEEHAKGEIADLTRKLREKERAEEDLKREKADLEKSMIQCWKLCEEARRAERDLAGQKEDLERKLDKAVVENQAMRDSLAAIRGEIQPTNPSTVQAIPTGPTDKADGGTVVKDLKRKIVSLEVEIVGKEAIISELYTRLG